MPYKNLVKELRKLDLDQKVKLSFDVGKKGLVEECSVSAEYEGYGVSFVASTNWRFSQLISEEMSLGEVVDVLKKKKLEKMTNRDFYGIVNENSVDGGTDFEDVEWDEGTPDEVKDEADLWDLYGSGDIDCENCFQGLVSLTIETEELESYVVDEATT